MSESQASKHAHADAPTPEELAQRFAALAERSQRAFAAFAEGQASGNGFQLVDPTSIAKVFAELSTQMLADPGRLVEAQARLWQDSLALWQATWQRMSGAPTEPLIEPPRGDRRFRDPAWSENLLFDTVKQSYLLTSRWLQQTVHEVDGLDPKTRDKADFYTRQFVSALSPSNFALTNPAVLERIEKTQGENLVAGLEHLLEDLERGKGRLRVSMTKPDAFEVGRNVAATPGEVVYQNELMQLIQYAPTGDQVHKRPLLIVPHWINKFYVLDLQPRNSLIKYAVDQGHTVFVISWTNLRKELCDKDFDDYMHEGPLAALDAIEQATGEREVNLLGFCIGGILTIVTLAYLAAHGDRRVKSASFLATLVDFKEVGEAAVFIDEAQLVAVEQHVAEKGYLEGHHMADMFNLMRENDLIWTFVVNNYLMGRDPMPFDLLYWNSDATRLPARMLTRYLRDFYVANGLAEPGGIVVGGVPIDTRTIKTPCYFLCTREDHIAPWQSSYPAVHRFGGPVRFVLAGSGHIAGVINPPSINKYCYWINAKKPADPADWLEGAARHEGSWWSDWSRWLARKAGPKVPARQPGDGALAPIESAPGSYVKQRASE